MKRTRFIFLMTALLLIALGPLAVEAQGPALPHAFFGTAQAGGEPVPVNSEIKALGTGVRVDVPGNPIPVHQAGQYGGAGAFDQKLLVQGTVVDGTPIAFYVNGIRAECSSDGVSWQATFAYRAGGVTRLWLRVPTLGPTVTPGAPTPTLVTSGGIPSQPTPTPPAIHTPSNTPPPTNTSVPSAPTNTPPPTNTTVLPTATSEQGQPVVATAPTATFAAAAVATATTTEPPAPGTLSVSADQQARATAKAETVTARGPLAAPEARTATPVAPTAPQLPLATFTTVRLAATTTIRLEAATPTVAMAVAAAPAAEGKQPTPVTVSKEKQASQGAGAGLTVWSFVAPLAVFTLAMLMIRRRKKA